MSDGSESASNESDPSESEPEASSSKRSDTNQRLSNKSVSNQSVSKESVSDASVSNNSDSTDDQVGAWSVNVARWGYVPEPSQALTGRGVNVNDGKETVRRRGPYASSDYDDGGATMAAGMSNNEEEMAQRAARQPEVRDSSGDDDMGGNEMRVGGGRVVHVPIPSNSMAGEAPQKGNRNGRSQKGTTAGGRGGKQAARSASTIAVTDARGAASAGAGAAGNSRGAGQPAVARSRAVQPPVAPEDTRGGASRRSAVPAARTRVPYQRRGSERERESSSGGGGGGASSMVPEDLSEGHKEKMREIEHSLTKLRKGLSSSGGGLAARGRSGIWAYGNASERMTVGEAYASPPDTGSPQAVTPDNGAISASPPRSDVAFAVASRPTTTPKSPSWGLGFLWRQNKTNDAAQSRSNGPSPVRMRDEGGDAERQSVGGSVGRVWMPMLSTPRGGSFQDRRREKSPLKSPKEDSEKRRWLFKSRSTWEHAAGANSVTVTARQSFRERVGEGEGEREGEREGNARGRALSMKALLLSPLRSPRGGGGKERGKRDQIFGVETRSVRLVQSRAQEGDW